jgi:Fe-S cluster biogenesis protein NfuA
MLRRTTGSGVEPRIELAISELGPMLHLDPGMIALVRFEVASGVAVLRLDGNCPDCGLSAAMLFEGISAHLKRRVPEVRDVRQDPSGDQVNG